MKYKTLLSSGLSSFFLMLGISHGSMTDFAAVPPTQLTAVDPNVMINLSIETPMQGAAYNDQNDGGSCSGRQSDPAPGDVGICYSPSREFIGIFDPNKCYTYTGSYFTPAGATDSSHACSGQWSGNFLNWATMTAIDEFRWALTGGTRLVDTATDTVVVRANMGLGAGHSWFPIKKIKLSDNVSPSTVTPYTNNTIYITNYDYRMKIGTSGGAGDLANDLNVAAKVCDSSAGLEDNCQPYGSNYKPEGLIQENALRMRFAVMSYLRDNSESRHGGVLRANMKYVGPTMPATTGGLITNSEAEWNAATGIFTANPNAADATASGVTNSGVINYINKFGANGYKSYDPIGELYYECLNYFKDRGPTPEFYSGLTAAFKDDFPVITSWDDPIQHSCQSNYIVGINDANPWLDKHLPGTAVNDCLTDFSYSWRGNDCGEPGNSDPDIDVTDLTNTVGALQGINGTSNRAVGCVSGNCDMDSGNPKTIAELGKAFGTAPWAGKENSYYIAGLSYYARSQDLRSDFPGQQYIKTFMIDTQEYSATPLTGEMNMLWLSGKYGGFNEIDNNDTNGDTIDIEPNATVEWDEDGDGQPDNYVLATDPNKLVNGLEKAFKDISERISSGSAAAVVGNTANGNGALVQALYQPKMNNTALKQQVAWGGVLHGIFYDKLGNLREDDQTAGSKGTLDDYATDKVIQLYYDTSVTPNRTRVQRYSTTDGITLTASGAPVEISELGVAWNARDLLSSASANMTNQRPYIAPFAATGTPRHILAGVDQNKDGQILASEVVDFTAAAMGSRFRYMDVADSTAAANIVNFVRGVEGISGFRTRTIDYDEDGSDEVWRLGDIIHSSPTIVGPPAQKYDVLHGDDTYANYKSTYAKRRQVAYVGGNDGMLHAFNMGFYDATNTRFKLTETTETSHPLGAELWAYVPGNLLPHLQWLPDPEYPHVYYMDGPVQQFDVNIFPDDDGTHVDGWGTIIVAGMRFGGGAIDLDTDGDSIDDYTTRSAYVILDVTDPESPPVLLAEITDATLGFTTSLPTLVTQREPDADENWATLSQNSWYLAFGSGPTSLATTESTQNAGLYQYDLVSNAFVTGFDPLDLAVSNSFVGNLADQDWDNDWQDDSLYFGLVENTIVSADGRLMQYIPGGSASTLIDTPTGQAIVGRPTFSTDETGNGWVYFGTGRLFSEFDNQTSDQQALYGIKDPLFTGGEVGSSGSVLVSSLQNTTGIEVYADRSIDDTNGVISPALSADTFDALQAHMATKSGWFRNMGLASPTERSFTNPAYFRGFMLATSYVPNADICTPEGDSYLYALYYKTGTAYPNAGLGNSTSNTNPGGSYETLEKIVLGKGVASDVIIVSDGSNGGTPTLSTNLSTGVLTGSAIAPPVAPSGRQSWIEIEL